MKLPSYLIKSLLLVSLLVCSLTGCSTLEKLGDYANENQIVVDIAVRQAVFRYIDNADTDVERDARAARAVEVVRKVDSFLEGNPSAGPADLLKVIENEIRWDKLQASDAMLLRDVMMVVRHNLQNRQSEGLLDADAVVGLRAILETAIATASML